MKKSIYFQVVIIPMFLIFITGTGIAYVNMKNCKDLREDLLKQRQESFLNLSKRRLKEMLYTNVAMIDDIFGKKKEQIKKWMQEGFVDAKVIYDQKTDTFIGSYDIPSEVLNSDKEFIIIQNTAYLKEKKQQLHIYVKDISTQIAMVKKEVLETFGRYEPSKDAYLFILQFLHNDPTRLRVVHSKQSSLVGEVLSGNLVPHGKADYKKQIFELTNTEKEGFLQYHVTLQKDHESKRYSYFYYYEPFDWIMGRGVYMDYLNRQMQMLTNKVDQEMQQKQIKNARIILSALLISLLITFLIARTIAKKIASYQTELEDINQTLEDRVQSKTKALRQLNEELENKVQEQLKKLREQDIQLIQQSKLLSMKELMSNIAHQWRQPLNALSIAIQMIEDDYEDGLIDEKYVKEFSRKNYEKLMELSNTIDNFKNSFKDSHDKEFFNIKEAVDNALEILSGLFKELGITVNIDADKSCEVKFYKSEFEQIIINVLTNSKDAFVKNSIQDPKIDITIECQKDIHIVITDNAGGIKESLLHRVFEPYTTTKFQAAGTGLGLYMAKSLLSNEAGADIACENYKTGVKTTITFKNPDESQKDRR